MRNGKVYLAGPIDFCSEEEAYGWRNYVAQLLGKSHVLDPTRRDYGRGYKQLSKQDKIELVSLDLEDINESEAVLVNCWKPGWGTPMEVVHAWQRMKYIVAVVQKGEASPWIEYHADVVVKSLDEGIKWIKKNVFKD